MKTTKKLLCFALIIVLCLLCGCENYIGLRRAETIVSSERYDILRLDEQYYFVPRNWERLPSDSGESSLLYDDYPEFSSVGEMRKKIFSGNCPYSRSISRMANQYNGIIPICSLDPLYEPVLPNSVRIKYVSWQLSKYGIALQGSYRYQALSGYMKCLQPEIFETFKESFLERINKIIATEEVLFHGTDPETNAEVVCYKSTNTHSILSRITLVQYTYTLQDKTLYVEESWDGNSPYVQRRFGSEQGELQQVRIWGEQNGGYFECAFSGPEEMSVDFIQSFGLKPYVETVTE